MRPPAAPVGPPRTGFGSQHAITVRPSGALRDRLRPSSVEAARKAELAELPAWIVEMDDDEAFISINPGLASFVVPLR